jgi:hypothetical protein
MKTLPKGPFLGINNRRSEFDLHVDKTGDFLRDAENVDIDQGGKIRRRKALALIQTLGNPHSLHMVSATAGYVVMGSVIYAITLPTYTQTLFKTLSNNNKVSWLDHNGSLYYSNGVDSGRITAGVHYPMALPTPNSPAVAAISGSLEKGTYQVSVAYFNDVTGEEGGISASSNPSLAATSGLRVTLPAAIPGATHINVYVSTCNGAIPMLHSSVATGTATVDVATAATGRESNNRFEAPLPAGRLFMFNNRLCSIAGSEVFEGIPYRPGYYLPIEGRIPFPAAVSNAVPAQNGVYIVSDKTYWLSGSVMTQAETVIDVLPYGGVEDTDFIIPGDKMRVGWFGNGGIVVANVAGQADEAMAENIQLSPPASGVSVVLSADYLRVVSCGWCMNLGSMAATRYAGYDITSASGKYATMADGIYEIDAASGLSDAFADLGNVDFGSEYEKRIPAVYVGASSDGPMVLEVQAGEQNYTYEARSYSSTLDIHRINPGLGLRSNWFGLTLMNIDGFDFTIASVSFAPVASTRRI